MKLAVVIPAYNEEQTVAKVISRIPEQIDGISTIEVIVVDDNSSDETYKVAKKAGAHVISHRMNIGAGGATLTGLAFSRRLEADIVVTLDADGQHNPAEIKRLVKKFLSQKSDLVIGSRFLSRTIRKMPAIKKFGNRSFSIITYLLSGKMVTDTQSGFRLFSSRFISVLLSTDLGGYEFCSETIMVAHKNRLAIHEVPISTIYDKLRRGGQNPLNGVNILTKLIYYRLVH
jgi:glycosyltransferase involved in cell wall biosynthesis